MRDRASFIVWTIAMFIAGLCIGLGLFNKSSEQKPEPDHRLNALEMQVRNIWNEIYLRHKDDTTNTWNQ